MSEESSTESSVNRLNEINESLRAFWQARDARERAMLILVAAVLVAGLFYVLFVGPALTGRAQLEKNLPPLRQQAAQMQQMAAQAVGLAAANASPPGVVTKESMESALAAKGLKAQNVIVTGDSIKVQLASVSFVALMDWLDGMQKMARLSVIDANITALPVVDRVNATLTLRQPKNDD